MIGGTARHLDATLVTADGDFLNDDTKAILEVETYR
jgi:predicted nucleic acid-binding protein